MGHPVVLLSAHDACDESGAVAGARSLARNPQVLAVIGPTCSSSALGSAVQILSNAGILTMSPSAINPKLTDPAQHAPEFLRTIYNGLAEGAAAADFVYGSLKARRGATAYETEPQGDAATTGFRDRFEQLGGVITPGSFALPSDASKVQPFLQQTWEAARRTLCTPPPWGSDARHVTKCGIRWPDRPPPRSLGGSGWLVPSVIAAAGSGLGTDGQPKPMYVVGPDLARFAQGSFYKAAVPSPRTRSSSARRPSGRTTRTRSTPPTSCWTRSRGPRRDTTTARSRSGGRRCTTPFFATKGLRGPDGTLTCTPGRMNVPPAPAIAVYQLPAVPLEAATPQRNRCSRIRVAPDPGGLAEPVAAVHRPCRSGDRADPRLGTQSTFDRN